MKLVETKCPYCGAALCVDKSQPHVVCEYCGSRILIDDGSQHIKYDNAEEAGYRFEKGRQRAQAEVNDTYQPYYPSQPAAPKKRRTWLWVLGWIFIFPVPLTVLMVRKRDLNIWIRIAIIAAAWIVFFVIGTSGDKTDSAGNNESVSEVQVVTAARSEAFDNTLSPD